MKRYQPMLAKSARGPFSGEEWLFEIKWDGIRAIAYVNDRLSLQSRNGRELAGQFPELGNLTSLAPGTVLDGEIVAISGGRPDIQSLLPRLQTVPPQPGETVPVTYIVFDILEKDGTVLVELPFTERRKILESAVTEGPHVTLSVPVEARGEDYYYAAIARGLEGVMAKRKDSRYEAGLRSDTWLKIKAEKTCDCIIAGYTAGYGRRSSFFGALVLALYDTGNTGISPALRKTRSMVYVGKVGTGFADRDLAALKNTFAPWETGNVQVNGTETGDKVTWLEPVLVCEVAYQAVTRDGKLRIPRFVRLRPEKKPEECTTDQFFSEKGKGNQHHRPLPAVLDEYQGKRDFSMTDEPEGKKNLNGKGNYFVIHEHHAHKLHYDLRLERDGVLKSWAVPKGMPAEPGEKHLAVAVEDHPLEYGHFEGTIPKGQYGAGTVTIWDKGTYDTKLWDSKKIEITFHGNRLTGTYVLVPFQRAGKDEWLVFRVGR